MVFCLTKGYWSAWEEGAGQRSGNTCAFALALGGRKMDMNEDDLGFRDGRFRASGSSASVCRGFRV